MENRIQHELGHKLLRYGIILFLLGLITGFIIPAMANPRMGLSSHLEGVMNGMLLVLFGLLLPKLNLSGKLLKWVFGLSLFGTFTNWATTFAAGIWGAGSEMMPIAGADMTGTDWQEILIKFGLISISISMIVVSGIILWGLRKYSVNY